MKTTYLVLADNGFCRPLLDRSPAVEVQEYFEYVLGIPSHIVKR